MHGASASCDTFLEPRGASLFDFLVGYDLDVWMLDWRGSLYVTAAAPAAANKSADYVAKFDLPLAVAAVHTHRASEGSARPLSVLAHCMGGACFAMSIGAGHIPEGLVDRVVLSAIGLFYRVTWDGWAKVQDRLLERVGDATPNLHSLSPGQTPWPVAFEEAYSAWPRTWGPPWDGDEDDFFRRLAFLYGQPFLVSNLHRQMDRDAIRRQFGAVPFELYRQAGQSALRGFVATIDAEGLLPAATPNAQIPALLASTYLNLERFNPFEITLITGASNPLWHRDSIDLMDEWLARRPPRPRAHPRTKIVLEGYGHQDLWWGKNSATDVFPRMLEALR
jgi:cholesterol oxidase